MTPCQPSRSSRTKAIQSSLPAAGSLPLAMLAPQALAVPGIDWLKVRPFCGEHGDGQERAADLDQAEPFDVRLAPLPAGR